MTRIFHPPRQVPRNQRISLKLPVDRFIVDGACFVEGGDSVLHQRQILATRWPKTIHPVAEIVDILIGVAVVQFGAYNRALVGRPSYAPGTLYMKPLRVLPPRVADSARPAAAVRCGWVTTERLRTRIDALRFESCVARIPIRARIAVGRLACSGRVIWHPHPTGARRRP